MAKTTSINIIFDAEKLSALQIYLDEKGIVLEDELSSACEGLYQKIVPATVRNFINLRSGERKPDKKKPKSVPTPTENRSDGS